MTVWTHWGFEGSFNIQYEQEEWLQTPDCWFNTLEKLWTCPLIQYILHSPWMWLNIYCRSVVKCELWSPAWHSDVLHIHQPVRPPHPYFLPHSMKDKLLPVLAQERWYWTKLMRCRIVDMDVIYKNAGLSYQIMFISLVYSVPLRLDMEFLR